MNSSNLKFPKTIRLFIVSVFLLFFSFGLTSPVFGLEIKYPTIPGIPSPQEGDIFGLVNYFFNLAIYIAGAIALVSLIIAGLRYLTSAGDSNKLKSAKQQITSAFLGIIILLSAYLMLWYINPELLTIEMPELEEIVESPLELASEEITPTGLFGKVRRTAEIVRGIAKAVEQRSQDLKSQIEDCDCGKAVSMCTCEGLEGKGAGGIGASCTAQKCYIQDFNTQPCPDGKGIRKNQKNIAGFRDELLYYRNRLIEEEKDILKGISHTIVPRITYYTDRLAQEEPEPVRVFLEESKVKLEGEKGHEEDLAGLIKQLYKLIQETELENQDEAPILQMSRLPNECLANVNEEYGQEYYGEEFDSDDIKCKAKCKQDVQFGCHDAREGCYPDDCTGDNPCPTGEIGSRGSQISDFKGKVKDIVKNIIDKIDDIADFNKIKIIQ